jgi:hypothetical protein
MNWRLFVIVPFFIVLTVYLGRFITGAPFMILALALALVIGLVTFHNPENGLLIILFSMLLSPEISLANIPGRPLTVRVDDLLIIAVFVAWLAHITVTRDWRGFTKTRLDLPILVLAVIFVLGTARGILSGSVNPLKAFFYLAKYIEYFILYWCVVNIVTTKDALSRYLTAGLITFIAVTLVAYSQFGQPVGVSAPFDKEGGEPASLGGYFLIIFALLISFMLHAPTAGKRLACLGLMLFLLAPFVKTLSRASYIAFAPMVLTLFLLTRKRKLKLGILLLAAAVIFPIVFRGLYADMARRLMVTFTGSHSAQFTSYQVGSQKITDQSALERITSWRWVLRNRFSRDQLTMLVGSGVTGIGFVEGQFFLVLGEAGILGVLAFYWLLFRAFILCVTTYRAAEESIPQGLSLAGAGSIVALLVQSLTTNTFIIVRIMEPFWFLIALVAIIPDLYPARAPEEPPLAAQGA